MPNYESVFIARQDISTAQVEGLVENFEKVITDAKGTVSKKESWGLRTLAYKIKKNRKGHYTLMNIVAEADAVHEMERQMRINEDVLRYMTLRVDELEEGPSVMLRASDGDSRHRRRRDDFSTSRNRDRKPAGAPEKTPEKVPEKAPEKAAEKAPEKAPETTSGDTP